ncbi:MAG: hypothetical protein JNK82_35675 [Myxococcaceae bacterium]|nr:hypothetical protein [Myxococcaceae bacterium]
MLPLFGIGSGIGAASAAGGLLLGAGLGTLTNSLAAALLLGAFTNLLLPPALTAVSLLLLGNLNAQGRFSLWLPLAAAFAVNGALYALVSLVLPFAVAWSNPIALIGYAVLAGVSMSGAATGVMALTERRPPLVLRSVFGPDDLVVASLGRVEL